ncbi:sugar kinase [Streptomyces sp. NPDC045431]|uniref:sugar kinase n=1 Tax=Streptomyces sp. NPDC045431 TaxID=3155613 RepID=UPI0033FF84B1
MTDVDVVCLGESLVTFLPSRPGPLADVPSFTRAIGGAESNVACALAATGHRVRWVSRVGTDGFGDHLVAAIAAYGVDTGAVRRDPHRPTGVYFRTATDRAAAEHEVVYYRAGSAASAMSPETVAYDDLRPARVLHLSGITAALSDGCLALLRGLTGRWPGRPLVSFDVNHRPALWHGRPDAADVLLELARGADVVFVGEDEAEAVWGVRGAAEIREALPEPAVVVVKQGGAGAMASSRRAGPFPTPPLPEPGALPPDPRASIAGGAEFQPVRRSRTRAKRVRGPGRSPGYGKGRGGEEAPRSGHIHVPAPRVDVVAATGAGDAFAAGFLAATLRGLDMRRRLRHGHLMAAAALTVPGDLGAPPATAYADRLVELDDAAWGRLHLGPGWTATGPTTGTGPGNGTGNDQEARTP